MTTKKRILPEGIEGFCVYTLGLIAAMFALPPLALDPASKQFIFVVGGIAVWRYSWGLVHFVRHLIYKHIVFPRWRKEAGTRTDDKMPPAMYLLITSFRIDTDTTIRVFKAAIEEAITCGVETTLVASIVEMGDEFLIKELFREYNPPEHIKLMFVRIPGTGKRDGLALAMRAISRDCPHPDSIVAVIDGDSIMEENLLRKCAPFFAMMPKLGALTTDEECHVHSTEIIRKWYDMRFAQRQILMCSMGLSKRVLTLTGRMSMFRASIVTQPDFISRMQNDSVEHWRLGHFKFLTGDDKTSWYHVLKDGWDMIYVPDTVVYAVESPPSRNFVRASTQLMFRWFGNMLRTNGRALALGPQRIGLFTWWCVFDQRISMWTSLSGPVFLALLCIKYSPVFAFIYFWWIGFTRWVMTLMLCFSRPAVSWYYPFLLYYNQIWGSLIKTHVFFRLDRQSWTRQKTKLNRGLSNTRARWNQFTTILAHSTAILAFICVLGLLSGVLTIPPMLVRF